MCAAHVFGLSNTLEMVMFGGRVNCLHVGFFELEVCPVFDMCKSSTMAAVQPAFKMVKVGANAVQPSLRISDDDLQTLRNKCPMTRSELDKFQN